MFKLRSAAAYMLPPRPPSPPSGPPRGTNFSRLKLGTPLVSGATVKAKVLKHGRGDKVRIFKLNRRKHYRRSQGHRQNYTEIEILGIA